MIWLLVGYMWLFIHRPFEIWPVLGTFRLERTYMIATILYWLVSSPRMPTKNRLHYYLLGFILVMIVSWQLSPYQAVGGSVVEYYLKYSVFYVLLVTSVHNIQDLKNIMGGYVCVMTLFMLHTLREYFNGNVWYAQGIVRMKSLGSTFSDYNDFAGLVVCALPIAWIFWHECTNWQKRAAVAAYFGISGYGVMLTASRMGACGFVLAAALAGLVSPHRWRTLAISVPLIAAVWIALPEKHQQRYLTIVDSTVGVDSARASAGKLRYRGFERGLDLFVERPLFGFGPNASGPARGTRMMLHNMYGQLLAELGLAGAIAFGLMGLGITQNLIEAKRISHGQIDPDVLFAWRTILATSASYYLLLFMGWGFNFLFWHVWLWFGGFQLCALHILRTEVGLGTVHECLELEQHSEPVEHVCI